MSGPRPNLPTLRTSRRRQLQLTAAALASAAWARPVAARAPAEPAPAAPFRLGLASYTFRKFDLDQTLAMTRRVALDPICLKSFHLPLDASPEAIAAAIAKVKATGLALQSGGVITMATEAQVAQAFAYARAAGFERIIAAPTAAMLPAIESQVKATGIGVSIHNHGPGDDNFPTPGSVYEKIAGLDPRIGLCIDIGHTVRVGDDLLPAVRRCADRLVDLHIKDVTVAAPEGQEVVIGRGIIDVPALLRLLVELGFKGTVAFEHEEDPDDPLPGLAQSVGYVRGALATMGLHA